MAQNPGMGTWAAGPFENDAALDFVGDIIDTLMVAVTGFVESPQIDDGFDEAFAAIALLNRVMEMTSSRPWAGDGVIDGGPIRDAMLRCFDEQIDGMEPDADFKREHREALVQTLHTFVLLLEPKLAD
jgi:hypothetical protein